MSDVELSVSDELKAWLVTEFGFVDFRAIRVFLSSMLVDTPTTGCFSILPEIGGSQGTGRPKCG
jgi:hypothetical protein